MFILKEQLTMNEKDGGSFEGTFSPEETWESKSSPINLFESEDEFLLRAVLQDCRQNELDIRFGCGALILSGPQSAMPQKGNDRSGFGKGREEKFEKYVHFQVPIQACSIRALFENGTLMVYLPKALKTLSLV